MRHGLRMMFPGRRDPPKRPTADPPGGRLRGGMREFEENYALRGVLRSAISSSCLAVATSRALAIRIVIEIADEPIRNFTVADPSAFGTSAFVRRRMDIQVLSIRSHDNGVSPNWVESWSFEPTGRPPKHSAPPRPGSDPRFSSSHFRRPIWPRRPRPPRNAIHQLLADLENDHGHFAHARGLSLRRYVAVGLGRIVETPRFQASTPVTAARIRRILAAAVRAPVPSRSHLRRQPSPIPSSKPRRADPVRTIVHQDIDLDDDQAAVVHAAIALDADLRLAVPRPLSSPASSRRCGRSGPKSNPLPFEPRRRHRLGLPSWRTSSVITSRSSGMIARRTAVSRRQPRRTRGTRPRPKR